MYNAINFSLPMLEIGFVSPTPFGGMANSTVGLRPSSYLCPSDSLIHPMSFGGDWAQINYAGNYGGPGMISSCNGIIVPSKGDEFVAVPAWAPCRLPQSPTGRATRRCSASTCWPQVAGSTASTAGYVSPYVAGTPLAKRCLFQINSIAPKPDQGLVGVAVAQQILAACKSIPGGTVPAEDAGTGYAWLYTQGFDTMNVSYSHVMTPNTYSCTGAESGWFGAQGNFTSDGSGGGWLGASTATSNHPGGVNVCFGDGSVKFFKDSVNNQTWWALGSRNLGEVISSDSY